MPIPVAIWKECNGEAHSNPYIDNCMVCLPYWGKYPVCPIHDTKLHETGYCKKGKHFCKKH